MGRSQGGLTSVVFVDTSGWIALVNGEDASHQSAKSWMEHNERPLCTTDYVLDETITLLRRHVKRNAYRVAVNFGRSLLESDLAEVKAVTPADLSRALAIFEQFKDQDFSFTDCTSFAVLERLKVKSVLAFDKHFTTMGYAPIV